MGKNIETTFENFTNDDKCDLSLIGGTSVYKNNSLEVREITNFTELSVCWNCGCKWAVCHKDIFFNMYKDRQGYYYLILIDGEPELLTQKGYTIYDKTNNVLSPHGKENLYIQNPGLKDILE